MPVHNYHVSIQFGENGWNDYGCSIADLENVILSAIEGTFPKKAELAPCSWPFDTKWKIDLGPATNDPMPSLPRYKPLALVTLTVNPYAVRVVRLDQPDGREDPETAAKILVMVRHHGEMLSDGWTSLGGGLWVGR
jgi:hypothetical protein